jgi:hypothetical protein
MQSFFDGADALSASINPITYRRNAARGAFIEGKAAPPAHRSIVPGSRFSPQTSVLPSSREPLNFTRKRRILKEQTNLSFGFALSALRSNTEK